MPDGSLSLPATLYLLAWETGAGPPTVFQTPEVDTAGVFPDPGRIAPLVRAGALTELAQRGLITDADGRVAPLPDAVTGDPVLDGLLELIAESRPHTWASWVTRHARATLTAVREQLLVTGYLRRRHRRLLGLIPSRTYSLERPDLVAGERADAQRLLRGTEPVGEVPPRDAALVALAAAGELRTVVTEEDAEVYRERIGALAARSGQTAPALEKAIAEVRSATAVAVATAVVLAVTAAAGTAS
ncbi:hypothetical protein ACZ90_00155 [Streptomyces albus subsp. albus]|nr:hypothetical protein ACZ90_00155 [Streptomyces albus subsp. albus]